MTLAILTHAADDFWRQRYVVRLLIRRWEAMGVRVAVVAGADDFVPADVALLHVDLSVVPEAYLRLVERYPQVLNGAVRDIRRRTFSRLAVGREGPDPGPVIVKTDRNCGGLREFRLGLMESPAGPMLRRFDQSNLACRALSRLEARRSWRRRRVLPVGSYRVYPSRDLVPAGVWRNPNLVVERFVAEREGDDYCCRHWLFFGGREVHRRAVSPHPVVKVTARLESISDPVPEELRAIRERLGFDYGKFDYGLVDGEVVLYDANRTPGASADPRRHAETIDVLSQGLRDVLDEQLLGRRHRSAITAHSAPSG
jgi:hypothetical protein